MAPQLVLRSELKHRQKSPLCQSFASQLKAPNELLRTGQEGCCQDQNPGLLASANGSSQHATLTQWNPKCFLYERGTIQHLMS